MISQSQQEILDEILTNAERQYIQHFVDQEELVEAVKKVLLLPIYYGSLKKGKKPRPEVNWAMNYMGNNNENLGAQIRACNAGIDFVVSGFEILSSLKKLEVKKSI